MTEASHPLLDSRYLVGVQFDSEQQFIEITYGEPYDRGSQAAILRTIMVGPEVGKDEYELMVEAINDVIDKAIEHIRETRQDLPQ